MKRFALILLLSVSSISCYSQKQKYSVVNRSEQLPDVVVEGRYWIVRHDVHDSIALGSISYHDLPAPKFFFLKNDLAVYEWGDEIKRTINVHDLALNRVLLSEEGVWPALDTKHEIVLFYQKKQLMVLDVHSLKTKRLLEVDVADFDYPSVTIDESNLQVSVNGKTVNY